jgi:hypothetical protein
MCCWGQYTCNKIVDDRDEPKFTVLLIHVVAATSHKAQQDSDLFALVLAKNFFRKYTKFDVRLDEHAHKFKRLELDSKTKSKLLYDPRTVRKSLLKGNQGGSQCDGR